MPPQVMEAMREASQSFVSIVELQHKAGAQIAKWTNNEAAMVSNGAASGILLATAVCIAGDEPEKKAALPFTEGMPNEVLVYGPDKCAYDYAVRLAGGKLVEYGSPEGATCDELEAAITDKTVAVMIFYFEHRMGRQLPVKKVVEIAHRHNIPVIVDAAAQLPPRENLWRFTRDWGADLAIFSGGKGLCGPQSSGLVVGKKEYIDRMISCACPNGGIGRPMKVGKEEIIGLMTLLSCIWKRIWKQRWRTGRRRQAVVEAANESAINVVRDFPSEAGQPMPRAKITLVEGALNANIKQVDESLKEGNPGIYLGLEADALYVNPQTLQPGDIEIIIDRLREVIDKFRK